MIGKNIWAAAATPAAPVPTPMQFYAVFQNLSCRRHVDNSCSSLVTKLRSACALMHATALPVLIVDLWILRINVNKKKESNTDAGLRC